MEELRWLDVLWLFFNNLLELTLSCFILHRYLEASFQVYLRHKLQLWSMQLILQELFWVLY